MTQSSVTPEAIAPLLLELARVFRAREFYPPTHPACREALERATLAWREKMAELIEVELFLRGGAFELPDGTPVRGQGIDELAHQLAGRRARRLRVVEELPAEELAAFIELLRADAGEQLQSGGLETAIRSAGLRHISTTPGGAPHHGRSSSGELELDWGPEGRRRGEAFDTDVERAEATSALIRALEAIEQSDDLVSYKRLAVEVERHADVLCRSKNVTDAYRAVLAWARHATDAGGRPGSIRAEASDRLGRMLRGDRMLQYVVDQACSAKGLASVQAIQVMMAVGPTVVPRVLEKLGNTTGDARSQAAGVLIAMGEAAFPSLVDELTAPEPERVRRAARLLGEMQNPRGVDYLVEHLDYADPMVKKEVARALVQIGTERAMDAVARGLEGDEGTAEIAAAALGCASPTDGVVRALLRVAEGNTSHSLVVRREAIRSLGRVGDARALPLLAALLEQRALFGRKRNRMLRVVAAQAIGRIGGEEAYRLLDAHTRGGDSAVRQACSDALRMLERAAQA